MDLNIIGWVLIFTGTTLIIGLYSMLIISSYIRNIEQDNQYFREQMKLRIDARKLPTLFSGQKN